MKMIVCSDLHLRKDKPRCRLDEDWLKTQIRITEFIFEKALENNADVYMAGDIYNTSSVPPEIENIIPNILKKKKYKDTICFILPGNHDIKNHNKMNINKSSIGVLLNAKGVEPLIQSEDEKIRFIHELVWPSKKDKPPKASGKIPSEIFADYPNADIIVSGDFHHNFAVREKGKLLLNPGCIIRQAADMKDYKPLIFLVDSEKIEIQGYPLPDTEPVVTDEYLRKEEERNDRLDSFIELLEKKGNVSLDFQENLKAKYKGLPLEVQNEIESIMEEV